MKNHPKFRTKIYDDIVHCSIFKIPHAILSIFKNELNIEFHDNRKETNSEETIIKSDCKIHIVYFKI